MNVYAQICIKKPEEGLCADYTSFCDANAATCNTLLSFVATAANGTTTGTTGSKNGTTVAGTTVAGTTVSAKSGDISLTKGAFAVWAVSSVTLAMMV